MDPARPRHRSLPALLDGPGVRWPPPVDRAIDAWAGSPPRVRSAARVVIAFLLLAAASGGLLRGPWGPPVQVVVARTDVPAGTLLSPADLTVAARPSDLVPAGALRSLATVTGLDVTRGFLARGSVVTAAHVATGGVAAGATPGSAVVPVPASLLAPLPIGATLDLVVTGFDGTARVAARGAEVVADDGEWRWVRITRDEVPAVAVGINDATLVAAVLPPPAR